MKVVEPIDLTVSQETLHKDIIDTANAIMGYKRS